MPPRCARPRSLPKRGAPAPRAPILACLALLPLACAQTSPPEGPGKRPQFAHGVVAADHSDASSAGAEILDLGGNAVDAAVATSFALSVVRPYSCGIGGGGFMLISLTDDPATPEPGDRLSTAIDYRERAPAAITAHHFGPLPPDAARFGPHAVAIPGTVAGLLHALETYGMLDRATVLTPAIRLAEHGFEADAHTLDAIGVLDDFLEERGPEWPGAAFLRGIYTRDGDAHPGMEIRNPLQALALRLIALHGRDGFYGGAVGETIVEVVAGSGGVLTLDDLESYEPKEVPPLVGTAFGREFVCMPLPSSGGVCILQTLTMLESRRDLLAGVMRSSPEYAHLLGEVFKHTFVDRARHLADPEFVEVDVDALLDRSRLRARAATIEMGRTHDPAHYGLDGRFPVDGGTSHFCVVDRWGNGVACTETINLEFGSRLAVAEFGFVLNNQMDDFLTRPGEANAFDLTQSERNLPAPGKRPLSSMSPTIVLDGEGRVEVIVGASGGPRIITGTLQAILNVVHWRLPAEESVSAPRFHHQWMPDAMFLEPALMGDRVYVAALRRIGHAVREREDVGNVQLIRRDPSGWGWQAAGDPRRGGRPAGR